MPTVGGSIVLDVREPPANRLTGTRWQALKARPGRGEAPVTSARRSGWLRAVGLAIETRGWGDGELCSGDRQARWRAKPNRRSRSRGTVVTVPARSNRRGDSAPKRWPGACSAQGCHQGREMSPLNRHVPGRVPHASQGHTARSPHVARSAGQPGLDVRFAASGSGSSKAVGTGLDHTLSSRRHRHRIANTEALEGANKQESERASRL